MKASAEQLKLVTTHDIYYLKHAFWLGHKRCGVVLRPQTHWVKRGKGGLMNTLSR